MNAAVQSTLNAIASPAEATIKSASPALDPLANEETFLKLLVSQLKNQDPLNPPDSSQFVSQLTAYSQLEQLIGIRKNTGNTTTEKAS
jgi:flagellar basal-body rod modification protein FlgD